MGFTQYLSTQDYFQSQSFSIPSAQPAYGCQEEQGNKPWVPQGAMETQLLGVRVTN